MLRFTIGEMLQTVFFKLDNIRTGCCDQNRRVGGDNKLGTCFCIFMQHPNQLELPHRR